ncbi:TauD/TfdA family dioxygenase [Streptosporangium canum]|uniref:TauD/TfdA family dioxygenase n=1 Tax=Streptosporangium canum TaxID=324952 RepID=UPI0033B557B0
MGLNVTPVREISPDTLLDRANALISTYKTASNPELIQRLPQAAAELGDLCPPPDPATGLHVLRGLNADGTGLGATPPSWSDASPTRTAEWDVVMLLLASAMGRPFGWEGQQDGRLVHDIVPSRGHEHEQTGASSTVTLAAHNEDAFHHRRAHLMLLGCLRNPDGVATSAASVRHANLDDADVEALSAPVLPILPDDAYDEARNSPLEPPRVPTLWHGEDGLCLRFDPAYTPLEQAGADYRAAYGRLCRELDRVKVGVRLEPGDVLVIDNDAVVHGREPFRARYDGTDRWLKRVNVRLPGRDRPSAEATEHGYGQQPIDPYEEG